MTRTNREVYQVFAPYARPDAGVPAGGVPRVVTATVASAGVVESVSKAAVSSTSTALLGDVAAVTVGVPVSGAPTETVGVSAPEAPTTSTRVSTVSVPSSSSESAGEP